MTGQSQQLHHSLELLKQQISNLNIKPEQWFKRSDLFNSNAFSTKSDDIHDYIKELQNNISRLTNTQSVELGEFLAEQIQTQFACLRNLVNSNNLNTKAKAYDKAHVKRLRQVQMLTKQVSKDSQQLYSELSELKEFERRLEEMVSDKQNQLLSYGGQKLKQDYQQQVLLTQQRLGRCRQAISKVEDQIQQLDSKNR